MSVEQTTELDSLRAELSACWLELESLQRQRQRDAEWMGEARINLLALIDALEDARAGKKIGSEALQLLERSRRTCKWV
jgi:hypothetical protein